MASNHEPSRDAPGPEARFPGDRRVRHALEVAEAAAAAGLAGDLEHGPSEAEREAVREAVRGREGRGLAVQRRTGLGPSS